MNRDPIDFMLFIYIFDTFVDEGLPWKAGLVWSTETFCLV